MVQLKAKLEAYKIAYKIFQFLMVQLKAFNLSETHPDKKISIPYGSIKRLFRNKHN